MRPKSWAKTSMSYAPQPLLIWRLLFIFFYFTLIVYIFFFIPSWKCCDHLPTCGRLLKYKKLGSLLSQYRSIRQLVYKIEYLLICIWHFHLIYIISISGGSENFLLWGLENIIMNNYSLDLFLKFDPLLF
jgi:hypothetical protein